MKMKRVEVMLDEADAFRLKQEAEVLGISRSDLLRKRALSTHLNNDKVLTPRYFHELVQRTRRRAGNGVDKRQVEGIVAFVISELAS